MRYALLAAVLLTACGGPNEPTEPTDTAASALEPSVGSGCEDLGALVCVGSEARGCVQVGDAGNIRLQWVSLWFHCVTQPGR